MKLLNLCCGNCRQPSTPEVEWFNVDNLHASLLPGTPERDNLDRESNYVNLDLEGELLVGSVPFNLDGILASHCVEHWTCRMAVRIMLECRSHLKPGGILLVSVPDAKYFKSVYDKDTVENAVDLFGEEIHLPDGEMTFTGYALWNRWHKAIITEDVLWHYFRRAGFNRIHKVTVAVLAEKVPFCYPPLDGKPQLRAMAQHLNRLPFSLVMAGVKE